MTHACPLCHADNPPAAFGCLSCGAPLASSEDESSPALPAGTLLDDGGYRVETVLGQGGFGITYRGRDLQLDRDVAIKEFFPLGCARSRTSVTPHPPLDAAAFQHGRERFLDEARLVAKFEHPGIVRVYTAWAENGTAYFAMELLRGQTLAQMVETQGPLPTLTALHLIEAVASALEYIHAAGTLHRDIKPDNIVVTDDGRVVLIDFGAARDFSAARSQGYSVVVTPGFAPLECYAERARRGAYSDVYALAATLFYLLTAQPPPAASDRAMGVELPPLVGESARLWEPIAAGLSIEVARRPPTVAAFREMLRAPSRASQAASSTNAETRETAVSGAGHAFVMNRYLRAFKRTRSQAVRVPDSKPIGPLLRSISQAQPEPPKTGLTHYSLPHRFVPPLATRLSLRSSLSNPGAEESGERDGHKSGLWSLLRHLLAGHR